MSVCTDPPPADATHEDVHSVCPFSHHASEPRCMFTQYCSDAAVVSREPVEPVPAHLPSSMPGVLLANANVSVAPQRSHVSSPCNSREEAADNSGP